MYAPIIDTMEEEMKTFFESDKKCWMKYQETWVTKFCMQCTSVLQCDINADSKSE